MGNSLRVLNHKKEQVFQGTEEEVNNFICENLSKLNERGFSTVTAALKFDAELMARTLNKFDANGLNATILLCQNKLKETAILDD